VTKAIPSYNPHYYAVLSDAVYKKDRETSQSYIQKSYPDAQVLEEQTVLFLWKFMLVKHRDELTVVFRGIKNKTLELLPAAFDHIGAPIPLIKGMEDHINQWQAKYGKIEVLTGHSKGAYFTDRVLPCTDLFRITFNGQYVLRGEKNINFRTEGDVLYNTGLSDKNLSLCIGPGEHEIRYCIDNLAGKKWSDISSVFKTFQQAIPHAPSNSSSGLELVSTRQQLLTDPQTVHQLLQANENATLYGRSQLISDDGFPLYPLRPFALNLEVLSPTPLALPYYMGQVTPETLSRCSLPWQTPYNPTSDVTTLSTSLEVPREELAQLEDLSTFDWDPSLPVIIPLPRSPDSSEREKPSFFERSRIIGIREGETRLGGRGLTLGLTCGAEVSIAAVDNKVMTGVSVPFSANLLSSLSSIGSGLMYAAPVAAVILAIYQAKNLCAKQFQNRINKDYRDTEKDLDGVNDSLQQFNTFFDEFSQGKVNQEAFLAKINDLHEQIHGASKDISKRGRYRDQDRTEGRSTSAGGRAFETHFAAKTKLRQIDRDLETIAAAVIAQRETQDQYTPKLKGRPFSTLCDDLQALFDKGVLSINEEYQQKALIQEISARAEHESIEALSRLDGLTNRPVAVSLQPSGVAKPMHLSGKHFVYGSSSSKKRRAERVKHWANAIDSAYQHFREVALTGNVEEMEKAAQAVFHQFDRAEENNVHKYTIGVVNPETDKGFKKTGDYYQSYITAIESNTKATLEKARAAKTGIVTPDTPVLFTEEELIGLKTEAAISAFNEGLSSFQIGENKDTAFSQMYDAAQVLATLKHQSESEEENQLVQSTIKIGKEYGTYTDYQKARSRLKSIETDLETLQSALEKTKNPSIKSKEYAKQYKLAYESAARLKDLGLVDEDVSKLVDNPESVSLTLNNVNSVYENYPHYVRIGHYEDTVLPVFSAPLIRFGLHVFNDFQQYEKYSGLKPLAWGLSTIHAIAPQALPSLVNGVVALARRENSAVLHGLGQKLLNGVKTNALTTTASFVYSPRQTLEKTNSLSKGTSLISNASTALQFVAPIVSRVFGETSRISAVVMTISSPLSSVSNVLYHTNIINKTVKYLRAGTLSLQLHKVSQGCVGLGLAVVDLGEIIATDPSELTNSNFFTTSLKKSLPITWHGQLPENENYYGGKDIVALAVTTAGSIVCRNSIAGSFAAWQLVTLVYNTYFGGYTDNALSSIMANCRYQLRQLPTDERNQALVKSLNNLKKHLRGNHRIDKKSDSPVKQQAKLFYFETNATMLEAYANWVALIEQTPIVFEDNTYKFSSVNLDVFDVVNVLFKHFSAASQISKHIATKIEEFEAISQYFDYRCSELSDEEKADDNIATIKENLKRIKSNLLSNFGIFYVKGEIESTVWVALRMFDAIPSEHRNIVDWWVLGCLVHQIRKSEDLISVQIVAVERFCFQTVVDMLGKKQGALSDFEQELHLRSQDLLVSLGKTLPDTGFDISTETQNFSQLISNFLSPTPISASLLDSKNTNWE
jgi:hypothetical protein